MADAETSAPALSPPAGGLVLTKTMVLETNHVCNLRCLHCYVPDESKRVAAFLDRPFVESLFDQFEENGFRYVLLTGGEPLAHPDFDGIYQSAWDRGFFVSLFTNGLLLDEERQDLLQRKPPAVVRVSLFGGTRESYRAVAGRDAFELACARVLALHARGVPVRVKIPLLRQNAADVSGLQQGLRARGIPCKIEVRIIPRFDRDTDLLQWRMTPEEIVELGLEDRGANLRHFEALRRQPPVPVRSLRYCLERCQPFVVSPEGRLQLCFFLRDWQADLRRQPLREAISSLTETMLADDPDEPSQVCRTCDRRGLCGYCPGWARNEAGRAGDPIPFLCDLSRLYLDKYRWLEAVAGGRGAIGPEIS